MRCFVIRFDTPRLASRLFLYGAAVTALLTAGTSGGATPHAARVRSASHVHSGLAGTAPRLSAARAAKTRCIGVDHVAGAVVFGDRAVELTMNGGDRWRMTFAQACPALSFYQGFYYRRAIAGKLCAGRDAVIARSGGDCPIDMIVRLGAAHR